MLSPLGAQVEFEIDKLQICDYDMMLTDIFIYILLGPSGIEGCGGSAGQIFLYRVRGIGHYGVCYDVSTDVRF